MRPGDSGRLDPNWGNGRARQTLIARPALPPPVEGPIRKLAKHGFGADAGTVEKIAKMGEAAFPDLARLATEGPDGEGPTSAVHLLAVLGHYRAQLAITSFLLEVYEDGDDDWVIEDLPRVLAYMGPGAVAALSGLVRHSQADMWVRHSAGRALTSIALDHPEHRPGVIRAIKEAVRDEKDPEARTWVAECLLDFVDPDLYEYYENLLLTGTITSDVVNADDLERIYTGEFLPHDLTPRDPLELFEETRRWNNPSKGGPCPCGSGKKYKRCCMGK